MNSESFVLSGCKGVGSFIVARIYVVLYIDSKYFSHELRGKQVLGKT